MKYLFLFFCLILCSCEDSRDGDCVPIGSGKGFIFNSSGGIDSIDIDDSWWSFTGVREEEGCEVKPDTVECSWFSVVKKNSIVFASVKQNDTGRERYEYVKIKGNGSHEKCTGEPGVFTISQCPELFDMELSKYELLFRSEGGIDSVIITTNRKSWMNDPYISVTYEKASYVFRPYEHGSDFSNFWSSYANFWFNINMIDNRKIIFSVNKNESGKERNFSVDIDSRCGANIKVIQSAE